MVFTREEQPNGSVLVDLSGSGSAVLSGTARLAQLGGSGFAWVATVRGPVQANPLIPGSGTPQIHTEGRFWIGIPSGLGVCYDYALEEVQAVSLAADGSIATVDHAMPWDGLDFAPSPSGQGQPVVRLMWEEFTSGHRWTAFAADGSSVGQVAVAHVVGTMTTADFTVVIGAEFVTVPAAITGSSVLGPITGEVTCGSAARDCVMCDDMPTPGVAVVTATWGLTLIASDRGDPAFTRLSSVLSAFSDQLREWDRNFGDDGVYWAAECIWIEEDNPVLGISFTPGTVLQADWDTWEGVSARMERGVDLPSGWNPAGYDSTAMHVLVRYDFIYAPDGADVGDFRGAAHYGLYQCATFDCLASNTFTLLDDFFELSWTLGPGFGPEYSPWITDWPASLTGEFA